MNVIGIYDYLVADSTSKEHNATLFAVQEQNFFRCDKKLADSCLLFYYYYNQMDNTFLQCNGSQTCLGAWIRQIACKARRKQ